MILTRIAAISYAANCALGASVATVRVDTSGRRWVHHALYISTATLTVAALGVLGAGGAGGAGSSGRRNSAFWSLLPVVLPLGAIPFAGTRLPRHGVVAVAAAPFYAVSLTRQRS